jgi:hypothetical protein
MTLDEILRDIHALEEDLLVFERKYGVLSDTFYQAYQQGEEPPNQSWVLDWSEWAATYELVQERRTQYGKLVEQLLTQHADLSLSQLIEQTARRESPAIPT